MMQNQNQRRTRNSLNNLIDMNSEFGSSLKKIQAKLREMGQPAQFRHYTRHDGGHLDRVYHHLSLLCPPYKLNQQEAYILAAAAYLHDIGMHKERPDQDIVRVRNQHELIGAEWIRQDYRGLGIVSPTYPDLIALTVIAHRRPVLDKKDYHDRGVAGSNIRMALLGSLMRLADELDLDFRRVDMQLLAYTLPGLDSIAHWSRHYYTNSVDIEQSRFVTIHFAFPQRQMRQYADVIADPIQTQIARVINEASVYLPHGNIFLKGSVIELDDSREDAPENVFQELVKQAEKYGQKKKLLSVITPSVKKISDLKDMHVLPHHPRDWEIQFFKCGSFHLPVCPLFGDGEHVWKASDITWDHSDIRLHIPQDVEPLYGAMLEVVKEQGKGRARPPFDNDIPHYVRWVGHPDDLNENITVHTARTTFFNWIAISRFMDVPGVIGEADGDSGTIRGKYFADPKSWDERQLPTPIGTALYLVVDHGEAVIVGRRSNRVGIYPNCFAAPIGGFVELAKGYYQYPAGQRNLANATLREAGEERALHELRREDLRILGMVADLDQGEVNLSCYAVLPDLKSDDIVNRLSRSAGEFREYLVIDFTKPEPVADLLRQSNWAPLDAFALFLLLRHFHKLTWPELNRLFK